MPVQLALLKSVIELVASDAVIRGAKAAYGKLPWARDARKAEAAERRTTRLVDEIAVLARTLPAGEVEEGAKRALGHFENDLVADGLKQDEAKTVADAVRAQLKAAILGPVTEIRRLQEQLVAFERDATESKRAVEELRRAMDEERRRNATTFLVALVAVVVAAVCLGLTLARR